MQHDDYHHQNAACVDFPGVMRNDGGDDQADRNGGDHRQYRDRLLRDFAEEMIDDKAERDRNDDHLNNAPKHRPNIYLDGRLQQQPRDRGCEQGRQQGVHARHTVTFIKGILELTEEVY